MNNEARRQYQLTLLPLCPRQSPALRAPVGRAAKVIPTLAAKPRRRWTIALLSALIIQQLSTCADNDKEYNQSLPVRNAPDQDSAGITSIDPAPLNRSHCSKDGKRQYKIEDIEPQVKTLHAKIISATRGVRFSERNLSAMVPFSKPPAPETKPPPPPTTPSTPYLPKPP